MTIPDNAAEDPVLDEATRELETAIHDARGGVRTRQVRI